MVGDIQQQAGGEVRDVRKVSFMGFKMIRIRFSDTLNSTANLKLIHTGP